MDELLVVNPTLPGTPAASLGNFFYSFLSCAFAARERSVFYEECVIC